ncbi:MAG: nicotinate-nucleotide adenylyltransferase [Chloroflexota bacterium]|nr:nicotinate-nucleotide adenylyltransferase [Chloroflexota bacterium]
MARVGLLGGTFDPIHLGHLILAELAHDALKLDRVEFLVSNDPPHKPDSSVSPAGVRTEMVSLAIRGIPYFAVNASELERSGPSYTVETLTALRTARPHDQFVFIVGGDSLRDLPSWHRPADVLRLARLAVIDRPGADYDLAALERGLPALGTQLDHVPAPAIDISSTALRAMVRDGRSIRFQTVEAVRAFIEERGLYRDERGT